MNLTRKVVQKTSRGRTKLARQRIRSLLVVNGKRGETGFLEPFVRVLIIEDRTIHCILSIIKISSKTAQKY